MLRTEVETCQQCLWISQLAANTIVERGRCFYPVVYEWVYG